VILGCAYTFKIVLSQPFMPREDQESDLAVEALPTKLTVQLTDTGDATVRAASAVPNAVDYTKVFRSRSLTSPRRWASVRTAFCGRPSKPCPAPTSHLKAI
jgi:hypothetical protein